MYGAYWRNQIVVSNPLVSSESDAVNDEEVCHDVIDNQKDLNYLVSI